MNASNLTADQREKEGKQLKTFLLWSLLGSALLHTGVMATRSPGWWQNTETLEEEIELVVDESPEITEEEVVQEPQTFQEEVVQEPELPEAIQQEVAFAPDIPPPPPAPALAPDSQGPQPEGEDAPSDQPPSSASESVNPMTSDSSDTKVSTGSGPISNPGGTGSGFGNADRPTGFVRGGRPDGDPKGQPNGVPGGKPNGVPGGTQDGRSSTTATRSTNPAIPSPPARRNKPQCVSCPKPTYQGKEGTPRVTYDIAPDGRVINVRLRKTSGDPETDLATLEAMKQWKFDPKTIPEGGQRNVRVRVTFEESGSDFQQQNEQRRQEEERSRVAEQERQQREAQQRNQPATPTAVTETKPTSSEPAPSSPSPAQLDAPEPPAPVEAAPPAPEPPAPVEAAPPPAFEPSPEPVYEPPPEPVYEPPPEPAYESPPAPEPLPAPAEPPAAE